MRVIPLGGFSPVPENTVIYDRYNTAAEIKGALESLSGDFRLSSTAIKGVIAGGVYININ